MKSDRFKPAQLVALTVTLLAVAFFATPAPFSLAALPAQADSLTSGCWSVSTLPPTTVSESTLSGVSALGGNDVWAVGAAGVDPLALHWDGGQWVSVPLNVDRTTASGLSKVVALARDNVWAAGGYYGSGSLSARPLVTHWDGGAWQIVDTPSLYPGNNYITAIAATASNNVWIAGSFYAQDGRQGPLLTRWDGSHWIAAVLPDGEPRSLINTVVALAPDNVWAAGVGASILHWDGSRWNEVPIGGLSGSLPLINWLTAVTANDIWAVGHLNGKAWATHWDGAAWSSVAMPDLGPVSSILTSLAVVGPSEIWAVGYYEQYHAPRKPLLLRWDGSAWHSAASPVGYYRAELLDATTADGALLTVGDYAYNTGPQSSPLLLNHSAAACAPPPRATPTPPLAPPVAVPGSGSVTFPQTGQTASGVFLDYWNQHGGLMQQGYPISPVIGETSPLNGQTYSVQYFERAVFEYHTENQPPYNVLLSQLGKFQYRAKYPTGAPNQTPNNDPGSVYFPQTGKRVGGSFLEYWQANGGLMQQGYPISDEFTEVSDLNGKAYTVQYFERAVFEYHPENSKPYDVLLSQLGKFQYDKMYNQPRQAPQQLANNVSETLAAGHYVFWVAAGLPQNRLEGYDLQTNKMIPFGANQDFVLARPLASDGKTLVWIETINPGLRGYDLATGATFTIAAQYTPASIRDVTVDNGMVYYGKMVSGGVAIIAHNIATGEDTTLVQRQYTTLANGVPVSDLQINDIKARDGMVVWSERKVASYDNKTVYVLTIHALKTDNSMPDTIIATGQSVYATYDLGAGSIAYAFYPNDLASQDSLDDHLHLYDTHSGADKTISSAPADAPLIANGKVFWVDNPFAAPDQPVNAAIKTYDIPGGQTTTLLAQNTQTYLTGVLNNGATLTYTANNSANDVLDLYTLPLPQ